MPIPRSGVTQGGLFKVPARSSITRKSTRTNHVRNLLQADLVNMSGVLSALGKGHRCHSTTYHLLHSASLRGTIWHNDNYASVSCSLQRDVNASERTNTHKQTHTHTHPQKNTQVEESPCSPLQHDTAAARTPGLLSSASVLSSWLAKASAVHRQLFRNHHRVRERHGKASNCARELSVQASHERSAVSTSLQPQKSRTSVGTCSASVSRDPKTGGVRKAVTRT